MADGLGFRRHSSDLYVYSRGNLVRRQQAERLRLSVWVAVANGEEITDGLSVCEFRNRLHAERAVLEAIR